MRKKILLVLLALILVIMGGCDNGEPPADEEIEFCFGFSLGRDGILYYGKLLHVTDYGTGATVPLCDKPNCAHEPQSSTNENPQCNAAFPGTIETAFLYQDKLYVFVMDGLNHTTVYMAESTGEGRRKIGEADYTWGHSTWFRNGKLYFSAAREKYQEDKMLKQEKELFVGSFDTEERRFEILTTPSTSLRGINLVGLANGELFYTQFLHRGDSGEDWENTSVDYIARNLETGEERNFLEGESIVNYIADYRVTESGVYYSLDKGGTYEYWKRETDGEELFLYSADHLVPFSPIINGEALLEENKSNFQKQLLVLCACNDHLFIMDRRNGSRHGIIAVDNYLDNIDVIAYPEFPNMSYYSE